eukprot:TRINITY_DN9935_c0_g2_i1.p3 TRINITY_DN9935_c0_g2~~TRINITY_DN9935_c0_g2_i1.p3  ORF type:complete len:121 (-),score=1.89 TRINITY_DN9935_c0_g2_i1:78-440(-)
MESKHFLQPETLFFQDCNEYVDWSFDPFSDLLKIILLKNFRQLLKIGCIIFRKKSICKFVEVGRNMVITNKEIPCIWEDTSMQIIMVLCNVVVAFLQYNSMVLGFYPQTMIIYFVYSLFQ